MTGFTGEKRFQDTRHHLDPDMIERLLNGEDVPAARDHLEVCTSCQQIWERAYRAYHWLRQVPTLTAPPELYPRVMQAITDKTSQPLSWRWRALLVTALVLCWGGILGLMVGVGLNLSTHWWPAATMTFRLVQDLIGATWSIGWAILRAVLLSPWLLFLGLLAMIGLGLWGWLLTWTRHRLLVAGR